MSTAALLVYALPLRKLRITGKNHDSARWLTSADVAEAVIADDYDATTRDNRELITDLDSNTLRNMLYQMLITEMYPQGKRQPA